MEFKQFLLESYKTEVRYIKREVSMHESGEVEVHTFFDKIVPHNTIKFYGSGEWFASHKVLKFEFDIEYRHGDDFEGDEDDYDPNAVTIHTYQLCILKSSPLFTADIEQICKLFDAEDYDIPVQNIHNLRDNMDRIIFNDLLDIKSDPDTDDLFGGLLGGL